MNTRDEIATRTRAIIAAHFERFNRAPSAPITDAVTLGSELGADSLDAIEILFSLEAEFDVEVSDAEAAELQTVGQIVDFIARRVGGDEVSEAA